MSESYVDFQKYKKEYFLGIEVCNLKILIIFAVL